MTGRDILRQLGVSMGDIQRNSETDPEHKVTVPYLQKVLGYVKENHAEYKFRVKKSIPVGSRSEDITPDIAVYVENEPFLIVDSKPINRTIEPSDANEAISNGRLYEFPKQFPFAIVSTGIKWEVYSTLKGEYLGDQAAIPSINSAKEIIRQGLPPVPDRTREQAERTLETLRLIKDRQQLQALFLELKTRIEAEGKHGHEALGEISKLIFAKIYEEQFSVQDNRTYRFTTRFVDEELKAYPKKNATDIINGIFEEANEHYRETKDE